MDDRCIALYDSGVGGFNLLYNLSRSFPCENYIYFSDRKNFPYGNKTKEEISELAREKTNAILKFAPKAIVFACNTLSTSVFDEYKTFPVRVFGVRPKIRKGEKTLVVCTRRTAESDYIKDLLKGGERIDVLPADNLAEEIENYIRGGEKPNIAKRFKGIKRGYDAVILGCTHYSYLKKEFADLFPLSRVTDGTEETFIKLQGFIPTYETARQSGKIFFADEDDKRCFNRIYRGF